MMAEHKYRWRHPNGRGGWTYENLEVALEHFERIRESEPLVTLEQSFDNGETWVSAVPALLARVRELEAEVERQRGINRRAELQTQGIEAERDAALSTIAKVEALVEEVIEAHSDRIGNHYAEYCYKRHVECFASVLRSRALGSVPSTGEGNE